jgi:hypothetical protein
MLETAAAECTHMNGLPYFFPNSSVPKVGLQADGFVEIG